MCVTCLFVKHSGVGSRLGLMTSHDGADTKIPHPYSGHSVPLRHQMYDERLLLAASEQARAELISVAHVAGNLPHLEATVRLPIDLTDPQRLPVFPSPHQSVSPEVNTARLPPQPGHLYQRPENYTVEELDRMGACRAYDMTKEPGERHGLPATENNRIPNMSPFSPRQQINDALQHQQLQQRMNMSPMSQGRLPAGNLHAMQAFGQPMRRSSMPFSDYERAAIVQQAVASIITPASDYKRSPITQPYYQSRRMSVGAALDSDRLPNFSSLQLPRRNTIDSGDSERSGSDSSDHHRHNHLLDDVKLEPHAKRPRGRPKRSSEGSDDATSSDPIYHRFACSVCSKGFPFKHSLTAHIRVHTGERPFTCDVCASTFTQLGSLNTHKKLHNQPVYKCTMCNWSTRKQDLLEKHIRLHYNDSTLAAMPGLPPPSAMPGLPPPTAMSGIPPLLSSSSESSTHQQ